MRAFAVGGFREAPAIHDLPIPAEDGAYLIRVTYAGSNPIDYKLLYGLTESSRYPFVVGIDFAGVVERAPLENATFRVGDRVFGMARTRGSYAEYTAVVPGRRTEPLARIPDTVTDEQAAALPVAALAALGSLDLLNVGAGQQIVVMGAAGAVGGYALQLARERGADVIATVRGASNGVRALGAGEVYDVREVDAVDAIRASHPRGVDAVLDLVNGRDSIGRDIGILRFGGRLVSAVGAADPAWFEQSGIVAQNIAADTNPVVTPQGLADVARMVAQGTLSARVRSVVDLDDAAANLDLMRHGGVHGKALVRI